MTTPEFNDGSKPEEKKAETVNNDRDVAPVQVTKSDAPKQETHEDEKPQSYVHLASGQVVRAYNEDLPGSAGAQNALGHWQIGNKVYEIIGIYPVETTVKG